MLQVSPCQHEMQIPLFPSCSVIQQSMALLAMCAVLCLATSLAGLCDARLHGAGLLAWCHCLSSA